MRHLCACAGLCGLGFGVGRCRRMLGGSQGLVPAWGRYKTAAEEIEMRMAQHVALQHLQPVDVACDKAIQDTVTPAWAAA
jgi:hypothetical protein